MILLTKRDEEVWHLHVTLAERLNGCLHDRFWHRLGGLDNDLWDIYDFQFFPLSRLEYTLGDGDWQG